jgi:hypothetical protein
MHDVARLRRQAKSAYEAARVRSALRIAAIVLPLVVLCARETGAVAACATVGGTLLLLTVTLRSWRRQGADAVSAGLRIGVIPMAAALGICRFAPHWPAHTAAAVCATAGLIAGLFTGFAMMQPSRYRAIHWIAVGVVAGCTAALGCVGLGLGTAAGGIIGVTAGTAVMSGVRAA